MDKDIYLPNKPPCNIDTSLKSMFDINRSGAKNTINSTSLSLIQTI